MKRILWIIIAAVTSSVTATAQVADDDIWREVDLSDVDFQKSKNYCMRMYGYYRYIDDGIGHVTDRELSIYRVYEGIFELDVRYGKTEDDGADIVVGRDLVHPEQPGHFMDFYELTPFTFLEKARRLPKKYSLETRGDSTFVTCKTGLAGYAVKDDARRELRMVYNALAPDTMLSLNLLFAKAKLRNANAEAVYEIDDTGVEYVPQGNLKKIIFEGDMQVQVLSMAQEDFHEYTELYVDSVVYMTKDEYKASMKLGKKKRFEQTGYTDADIDRLKLKFGVKPLSDAVMQRIEEQRDWDEQYELWKEVRKSEKSK